MSFNMIEPTEGRLNLSIQKGGQLGIKSERLLGDGGLKFVGYDNGKLFSPVSNFPLVIYFDRDDDIAPNVAAGIVSLGIVGRNMVEESRADVVELLPLGFGVCRLVVAAPPNIVTLDQLEGAAVATSYPNSAQSFFGERNISIKLLERSGSIEAYPSRGVQAIVDLTKSGSTLTEAGLVEIGEVYKSEAVLIANPGLREAKGSQRIVRSLVRRILSVQRSEGKTYIALNAPASSLKQIAERIPGETSPTVSRLQKRNWIAVSAVVPTDQLDEIVDDLQQYGAEGILELNMKRMFPDRDAPQVLEVLTKLYG